MHAESDAFAEALAREELGLALVDEALTVTNRFGRLSDWLPREGDPEGAVQIANIQVSAP